jgi:hypothetical protein
MKDQRKIFINCLQKGDQTESISIENQERKKERDEGDFTDAMFHVCMHGRIIPMVVEVGGSQIS